MRSPKVAYASKNEGVATAAAPSFNFDPVLYEEMPASKGVAREDYAVNDADILLQHDFAVYQLRVRDMEEEARPRERLLKNGPEDLSMTELVAIVLGFGTAAKK